jgi:hypothetical protein
MAASLSFLADCLPASEPPSRVLADLVLMAVGLILGVQGGARVDENQRSNVVLEESRLCGVVTRFQET